LKTAAHIIYKLSDGTKIPGVTTILNDVLAKPALIAWANRLGLQGIDSARYRDEKAEIGTLAHYLILCHFRKETPETADYSPNQLNEAENSLIKYWDWEKAHTVEPILVETPFVSGLGFGGTIDLYGKVDGELALVDFKTGSGIYDEMFFQLAAYKLLLEQNGHEIKTCRILRIGRDDKEGFEERVLEDLSLHLKVFLNCLEIYRLKREIKGK